jgi:hypothetical protein
VQTLQRWHRLHGRRIHPEAPHVHGPWAFGSTVSDVRDCIPSSVQEDGSHTLTPGGMPTTSLPTDGDLPLEGYHMPEQLRLSLPRRYWRVRRCEGCGREHEQVNSPICYSCRYQASKHRCAIPGCGRWIASSSTTCLWHRPLQDRQPRAIHARCVECSAKITPSPIPVCDGCRVETSHLCACGCGRYRRKYDAKGVIRLYISGHNDVWADRRRPLIPCAACQRPYRPSTRPQRLCSTACRTVWLTINPPNARTRVLVKCAICGTQVARIPSQVRQGKDAACSPRCRYILVANKLRGRTLSEPKRLAWRRDGDCCQVCGFDTLVEVHHTIPRRHGGPDTLDNLITLCPNHHTMADCGLISRKQLRALLTEHILILGNGRTA